MSKFTDNDRLRWVYEGQLVWAPLRRTREGLERGMAFKGVVAAACGDMARVECQSRPEWNGWFDVLDLFPRQPDPPKPPGGGEPIPTPQRAAA